MEGWINGSMIERRDGLMEGWINGNMIERRDG